MNKKLSRRDFLKLAGVTSAGLALSACGVKATESPTATYIPSTSTSLPTETLTPTLTSTPTLPLEQLPETKEAIDEFIQAFQAEGVNITSEQLLQKGLELRTMTDKNENHYDVAFVHLEDTSQFGGDYPLIIKSDNEWSRQLFGKNPQNINFGYTRRIEPKEPMIDGKNNANFFDSSSIYPSNQFYPWRNLDGKYSEGTLAYSSFFSNSIIDEKELEDFINKTTTTFNGIKFSGDAIRLVPKNPKTHAMVITSQREIQGQFDDITDHTIAERAFVWFIANAIQSVTNAGIEFMLFNELLRDGNSYWSQKMNKTPEEVIELAARSAKIAAKDSKITIMINEFGLESSNNSKRTELIRIIDNLRQKGVFPKLGGIAIGIQYHNGIEYNVQNLKDSLEYFYTNGISDIRLTEVDIMQKGSPTNSQITEYYFSMLKTVKEVKNTHQDLNMSIIFFDEQWDTDNTQNTRITDVPTGLYQVLGELYK